MIEIFNTIGYGMGFSFEIRAMESRPRISNTNDQGVKDEIKTHIQKISKKIWQQNSNEAQKTIFGEQNMNEVIQNAYDKCRSITDTPDINPEFMEQLYAINFLNALLERKNLLIQNKDRLFEEYNNLNKELQKNTRQLSELEESLEELTDKITDRNTVANSLAEKRLRKLNEEIKQVNLDLTSFDKTIRFLNLHQEKQKEARKEQENIGKKINKLQSDNANLRIKKTIYRSK
jgi:DNA repair exonuclease SbcCD ATPase subunit